MEKKKKLLLVIVMLLIIIVTNTLSIMITKFFISVQSDTDYQKLELKIEDYDIEYSIVYEKNFLSQYKVYKINNSSIDRMKEQLESSTSWNKNKFYEYIMMRFYEKIDNKKVEIERDDLYYYNKKGIYAILDVKNAKLYYFENDIFNYHNNYKELLGIHVENYKNREIYSVRSGPQKDGTDYYTYEFTKEKRKAISQELDKSTKWSKEKLDDDILANFIYNKDILFIKNGYYYYEKVCRTSDKSKKYNFTDAEATGWKAGVYDADKNILYFYWTSY